jgi:hypothetical protein
MEDSLKVSSFGGQRLMHSSTYVHALVKVGKVGAVGAADDGRVLPALMLAAVGKGEEVVADLLALLGSRFGLVLERYEVLDACHVVDEVWERRKEVRRGRWGKGAGQAQMCTTA